MSITNAREDEYGEVDLPYKGLLTWLKNTYPEFEFKLIAGFRGMGDRYFELLIQSKLYTIDWIKLLEICENTKLATVFNLCIFSQSNKLILGRPNFIRLSEENWNSVHHDHNKINEYKYNIKNTKSQIKEKFDPLVKALRNQ